MNKKDWLQLLIAIGVCQLAGLSGSVFTVDAIPTWYAGLAKPELAPPNQVFAPVWVTLYTLMGIAAFLVLRRIGERPDAKPALGVFAVQLGLNALWSIIFFGLRSPLSGLAVIGLLWIAILFTIVCFAKVSRAAAALLVPYLLWVSFASYLNYAIWSLNP